MYKKELELAKKAAIKAGEYLKTLEVKNVDSMEGRDIKLEADRKSEEIIMDILKEIPYPILAEESGRHGEQKGLRWIVDPIDGTYNYFKGLKDLCCVSIALWEDDTPVLGVINRFGADEIYEGIVGVGAKLNDAPIFTSDVTEVNQASCATGFPSRTTFDEQLESYMNLSQSFKKIRMLGTASLMSVFVGAGFIDFYREDNIMLWDIAAGAAITLAAGGEIEYSPKSDNRCRIRCFANKKLMENYRR